MGYYAMVGFWRKDIFNYTTQSSHYGGADLWEERGLNSSSRTKNTEMKQLQPASQAK